MTFPYPQTDEAIKLKARLTAAANVYFANTYKRKGVYLKIQATVDNTLVWESGWSTSVDHLDTLIPARFFRPGLKVRLIWMHVDRAGRVRTGSSKVSYAIVLPKRGIRGNPIIRVPTGTSGFTGAIALARSRATRPPKVAGLSRMSIPRSKAGNLEQTSASQFKLRYNNLGLASSALITWFPYARTKVSVNTPNFLSLKRRGRLPINNYSMSYTEIQDAGCYQDFNDPRTPDQATYETGPYLAYLGVGSFGNAVPAMGGNPSVDNRAVSKLMAIGGNKGNGVAQNLAQISQNLNLVTSTATKIYNSVRALKRGNMSGAINALTGGKVATPAGTKFRMGGNLSKLSAKQRSLSGSKALAENWLALQYGWKPLLQDLHDSFESIARLKLGNIHPQVARATAYAFEVSTYDLNLNTAYKPKTGTCVMTREWTTRYGLRYVIDDHLTSFLAQSGITNPIALGWELVPFSFVVDWFLPIGPYLDSLQAWNGLSFVSGWVSQTRHQETFYNCYYSGPQYAADGLDNITLAGGLRHSYVSYARSQLSGFPSMTPPVFKNPFSVGHVQNALALMRTAFK